MARWNPKNGVVPTSTPTPTAAPSRAGLERSVDVREESPILLAGELVHDCADPGEVGAAGAPLSVAYLRIDRDVYYINERMNLNGERPGHGVEGNPFSLREDEFFVCGDNSPKSFDCRLWPLERPVIPRRNLVGKAFFVYWPAAGTRHHIPLAPDPSGWRLVH